MRDLTHRMLELDGGVVNGEIRVEASPHVAQNAFAGGRRDISN
jgi:hypothetical protein